MKYYLTYDEAVSILPNDEYIHTFRNESFGLIGADWSREEILAELKKTDVVIELTGKHARNMGHGMCAYSKDVKWQSGILFIETNEEKLCAFENERGAQND